MTPGKAIRALVPQVKPTGERYFGKGMFAYSRLFGAWLWHAQNAALRS